MAIRSYCAKSVKSHLLARPAVEGVSALAFCRGLCRTKIRSLLRPLYDALYDMPIRKRRSFLLFLLYGENVQEIATIALMRGRTT